MEQHFGADFGRVQVRSGASAADSAARLGANAYTIGSDVVFGADKYHPETREGRRLISHELAHVLQQRNATQRSEADLWIASSGEDKALEAGARQSENGLDRPAADVRANAAGVGGVSAGAPSGLVQRDARPSGAAEARQAGIDELTAKDEPVKGGQSDEIWAAIKEGWRAVRRLNKTQLAAATVEQRMAMLAELINAYWTGGAEEEAILRILASTPRSQAANLAQQLAGKIDGKETFFEALDRVVDLGNNLDLHAALSQLRIHAMGATKGTAALLSAPVLPWHDVMGAFEQAAVFELSKTSSGRVIAQYTREAYLQHSRFGPEIKKLQYSIYDADQVLIIHDYDSGRFIPVVAGDLVGYGRAGVRSFLSNVATVASLLIPVGAATSAAGKGVTYAFERVLPLLIALVDENRLNLVEWFPSWGPRMIYYADLAKVAVGAYGFANFAKNAGTFLKAWRAARNSRQALEGAAGASGVGSKAEQVAKNIEKQADEFFVAADEELAAAKEPPTSPGQGAKQEPVTPDVPPAKPMHEEADIVQKPPTKPGPANTEELGAHLSEELGLEKPGAVTPPLRKTQFEPFRKLQPSDEPVAAAAAKRLEIQSGIKIPPDRVLEAPWAGRIRRGGKATSQTTSEGWTRNESRFWTAFDAAFPADAALMTPNRTVTPALAEKYGWPPDVVGAKLIHHHIDDGPYTVAIPVSRHAPAEFFSKVHPEVTIH
jgi:hypothetical protein